MISTPVTYSQEDRNFIGEKLKSKGFCSTSWTDNELEAIKSSIKRHYVAQQSRCCCYCQHDLMTSHGRVWDTEHVISRSEKPEFMFEPENLAISCIDCNTSKGNQPVTIKNYVVFPRASQEYRIVHPHFDNYHEHIAKEDEYTYRGITKKGSFTIFLCDLFRFWQEKAKIARPIRDARFERDIAELRFVKTKTEARPIVASILARLEVEEEALKNDGVSTMPAK